MNIITLLYILIWLVCSVGSYLIMKMLGISYLKNTRKEGEWTCADRASYLTISLIGGPIALMSAVVILIASDNRPAKW